MLNKILVAPGKAKEESNNNSKVETPSTTKAKLAVNSIEINMGTSITDSQANDRTPGSRGIPIKEPQTSKNSSRGVVKSMNRC